MMIKQDIKHKRNQMCHCGSGLHHKKCCLLKHVTHSHDAIDITPDEKACDTHKVVSPLMTTTNEFVMPIRLYYTIRHRKRFIEILHSLSCVEFATSDHFYINYWREASTLGLSLSSTDVPKNLYPIILAHGFIQKDSTLHLNLRSFERGLKMIEWINNKISSKSLKLTHIATHNAILDADTQAIPSHELDEFLGEEKLTVIDPKAIIHQLRKATEHIHDFIERRRIASEIIDRLEQEDFALSEKFPANYYEDGIQSVELSLNLRWRSAFEKWKGNADVKFSDILQ